LVAINPDTTNYPLPWRFGLKYTSSIRIRNSSSGPKRLWVEPWGDEITMQSGVVFEVVAEGPVGDCLEVEAKDSEIFVYGWSQSIVRVFELGKIVREYTIPSP
jgi:uncharacterized protein affecting Mg2+/Co2+ transport